MSPRRFAAAVCSAIALFGTAGASADVGDPYHHAIEGGFIANPLGLYTRYHYTTPIGDTPFQLGAFAGYQVYSAEVGAEFAYRTDPAWLNLRLELGAEPGVFLEDGSETREPHTRFLARGQALINLQLAHVWFYSRTTGLARYRDFVEDDTFQGYKLEREWGVEQATAFFVRLAGTPPLLNRPNPASPSLWIYTEYTVGALKDRGTWPNRVSGGLVTERWLSRAAFLNVDVFYSFAESHPGPGVIFLYWLLY